MGDGQEVGAFLIIFLVIVIIVVSNIRKKKSDERLSEQKRLRQRQEFDQRIREREIQESLRESLKFPCPHCSNLLSPDSSSCYYCKVEFIREGKSGTPEITKGFRPESFDKRLEPYGLSKERYLELFESWEHGIVHPVWFLREVIQKYKRGGQPNGHYPRAGSAAKRGFWGGGLPHPLYHSGRVPL